ncbi:MAG: hypothetical protein ACE5FI_01245 [Anaerolineales bacterium]
MEQGKLLNWKWFLSIALIPVLSGGLYVSWALLKTTGRYDAAYFTPEYRSRFNVPGKIVLALEPAIQTGDTKTIAALQGLRNPEDVPANPDMYFYSERPSDATGYLVYLFEDRTTDQMTGFYVRPENGRYVLAPQDLHFYLHSGRWLNLLIPIAIAWWVIEGIVFAMVTFHRLTHRERDLRMMRAEELRKTG